MKERILIARQLIKIAEQITKQEEKKQQNVIKQVYKKIKDLLGTKSLFKHKIKNKIVKIINDLIDNLYEQEFINEQEVKELQSRLEGKKASKIAGKKGFVFVLLVALINILMPLTAFCNTVTEKQQKSIEALLNSKIECESFSRTDYQDFQERIKNTQDEQEKMKLQKSLYDDDVYDLQQCEDTDIHRVIIKFSGDNESYSYYFNYRTKTGTQEIIKPNKISESDFKKVLTIIALFDKDNATGLRGQIDDKILQQFIEFNEKLIEQNTSFLFVTKKDTLAKSVIKFYSYEDSATKSPNK